jgi:hypothetical protein
VVVYQDEPDRSRFAPAHPLTIGLGAASQPQDADEDDYPNPPIGGVGGV